LHLESPCSDRNDSPRGRASATGQRGKTFVSLTRTLSTSGRDHCAAGVRAKNYTARGDYFCECPTQGARERHCTCNKASTICRALRAQSCTEISVDAIA